MGTPRRAVRVSPVEFSHQPTAIMSASLACKAALLTSRLVVGKAPGRSARRSSTICAAASGDEQQLSRALRTVNTGALMQAGTKAEAKNTTFKTDTKKESKEVAAASSEASAPPSSASVGKIEYILKGPAPQKFGVADGELGNVLTASGSFVTRAVSGALCEGWNVSIQEGECPKDTYTFGEFNGRYVRETSEVANYKRPAQPIQIYEFEGCPFCKKVREAVIWLDLDVLFYPCPQGGPTFREQVKNEGGRDRPTFPYMVDPNTETKMFESDDIIDYLYDNYGPGKERVSSLLKAGALTVLTAGFGLAPRMGAGSKYKPATMPEKPITVYSYEASPFCKLVREKLVELELPHLMKSSGRGSPKRQELFDKRGRFQAPYIEDPNTGIAMFESSAIVKYLEETYAK